LMLKESQAELEVAKSELSQFNAAMRFVEEESPRLIDSLGLRIAHNAERIGDRPCLGFEGTEISWKQFNELVNRHANALASTGVKEGDVLGVMIENRIEFCIILAAVSKLKAIASLINTNLTSAWLAHSIEVCNANWLIYGEEVLSVVEEYHNSDGDALKFIQIPDEGDRACPSWSIDLYKKAATASSENPPAKPFKPSELVLYLFTSGTTGMPKAVNTTNIRHLGGGIAAWKLALRSTELDRCYVVLPLYHGTALTAGFVASVYSGGFTYLKRKFSAGQFLSDVREHNLNLFVYVGEICRYLTALPKQDNDIKNPLTTVMGNGLRPEIWSSFKERFGIDRVCELYSASEANVNFFNALNKDRTVGFPSNEVTLIEYDIDEGKILRDEYGRCITVGAGDTGLMLSRISEKAAFQGYTDSQANEEKIVRDALESKDQWFNSGDLMRQVDVGFSGGLPHYQFVDRVGDTFRWKSENVSTMAVAELLHEFPDIETCNVYGVEVPKMEGKACMVAVKLINGTTEMNFDNFLRHIKTKLPAYARPLFVRIQAQLETTGTFKLTKGKLQREGFDPGHIRDPLLFFCERSDSYIALNTALFEEICSGKRRL